MEKANAGPVMGLDRGSRFALSRKGADFHMVLNYERICRIVTRRKANEHESVCVFWRQRQTTVDAYRKGSSDNDEPVLLTQGL